MVWANDGGKSQPSFSALIKVFVYFLYRYLQNNADYMQHKGLLNKRSGNLVSIRGRRKLLSSEKQGGNAPILSGMAKVNDNYIWHGFSKR